MFASRPVFLPADEFVERIFGVTAILATPDFGNGNVLGAQEVEIFYDCTLKSFHFYVVTAAGTMRMGLYDESNNLVIDSGEFTPTTGWNTKTVSDFPVAAGIYWLAHHPSSNTLAYRNNAGAGGHLKYVSESYGPLPSTFPGGATAADGHWSAYITIEVAESELPAAGFIRSFNGAAANWSSPSLIDELPWFNHHAGNAWSLQRTGDVLRFELREDEIAIDVDGERSEISSGFGWDTENGPRLIKVAFDFRIRSNPADLESPNYSFMTLLQIHGASHRPLVYYLLDGPYFFPEVNIDAPPPFGSPVAAALVQDQWYSTRCEMLTGASGYCKVWLDEVLVTDFTGSIPTGAGDNYLKLGTYREPGTPQTVILEYRNIDIDPETVNLS